MNIEEKVKGILSELSGEEEITNEMTLQNDHLQGDLALDSLMMVTMLVEIEEVFRVELDEADMNPFDLSTVQSVIDMVTKYCGDKDE